VLLVASTLVALGGFAGAVWLLWALFGWPENSTPSMLTEADLAVEEDHAPAPPAGWSGPLLLAALSALRRQQPKTVGLGTAPR
jgi:hypothetical protein